MFLSWSKEHVTQVFIQEFKKTFLRGPILRKLFFCEKTSELKKKSRKLHIPQDMQMYAHSTKFVDICPYLKPHAM